MTVSFQKRFIKKSQKKLSLIILAGTSIALSEYVDLAQSNTKFDASLSLTVPIVEGSLRVSGLFSISSNSALDFFFLLT